MKINLTAAALLLFSTFTVIEPADAVSLTYVDPGYSVTTFTTLTRRANALAFDPAMNLYTDNPSRNGTGQVGVREFTAASSYTSFSEVQHYATTSNGISGLDFSGATLYASEANSDGNSGRIANANTGVTLKALPDFRPTGIDARGSILFTGRLDSNGNFGNVYQVNPDNSLSTIIPNIPLRGIATEANGDIFVSTRDSNFSSFIGMSIYKFLATDSYASAVRIATFGDIGPEELTVDSQGILYSLHSLAGSGSSEIMMISAVPEPEIYAMIPVGLVLVGFMARRRKQKEAA